MFSLISNISSRYLPLLLCMGLVFSVNARQRNRDREQEKPIPPAQTHRAEIESDSFTDDHQVHALPDTALLVVSTKRDSWFGKNDFILTKYDRELKVLWQAKHEHKTNHNLLYVTAELNKIYLLFSTPSSKKLVLYQIDSANGQGTYSEHVLPSSYITIQEMSALNGQVFLSGLERFNLNMLHLNPKVEDIRLLPAVFGEEDDLGEFRVDTLSTAVEFVVSESNGIRSRVQVKRLNNKGDVIGTYFIQPELDYRNDNTLQPGRLTPGDTLSKLLIGTYGFRTSMFSKGLYTSDLFSHIKYYDFGKLDYFFEYLSPRGERRMKAKYARQEAKGKPPVLRYRLLLHSVIPHPQGYAIIGEIYYPQYRNNNYSQFNTPSATGYPYPIRPNRSNLDGYRFTHAIVCVFDKQGNLLWDNSYKLKNLTYPELAPTIEAGVTEDGHITLVYPEDEFIWYKTLKPKTSVSNEEKVEIRLKEETEKRITSNNEGIVHWYGGNFISFGFQRIRPVQGSPRNIFYLQNLYFR